MAPGAGTARNYVTIAIILGALATAAPASPRASINPNKILEEDPSAGRLIGNVPFIAQDRFDCGPASVAMVLRFWGVAAEEKEIAKRFESEDVAGTFTVDLLIAASDAGMDAHWIEGDFARLKAEIDAGRPVIVFLNLAVNPLPKRHFAVTIGYLRYKNRDYVILHSGAEEELAVGQRKFMRWWKRTGKMMMTVVPKEHFNNHRDTEVK